MNVTIKSVLYGASAACGLLLAATGTVWAEPVHITWTGTGWDTHVDNFADTLPINMITASATGSFGADHAEVATEFYPANPADYGVVCSAGHDVFVGIVLSTSVMTFKNHDQLFAFSNDGWMCLSTDPEMKGHFYGVVTNGWYGGGTGRFANADGDWMTTFEGYNLELPEAVTGLMTIGFRSISGEISGNVNMHEFGAD
ncbi:MAG: hypothetical protein P8Y52_13240 [Xanthomonadales bacterium]